jgi:hypothetical protein
VAVDGKSKTKATWKEPRMMKRKLIRHALTVLTASAALLYAAVPAGAADNKPNVVILMTDDTGWNDFGCDRRPT